jgi:hypothetical protein
MSGNPIVAIMTDDAINVMARLASVADQLNIVCLSSPGELTALRQIGVVISDHAVACYPTIRPQEVLAIDPADLVALAIQHATDRTATAWAHDRLTMIDNPITEPAPPMRSPTDTTAASTTRPAPMPTSQAPTISPGTLDHGAYSDEPKMAQALTPTDVSKPVGGAVDRGEDQQPSDHNHRQHALGSDDAVVSIANQPMLGCRVIPVIGTDPSLSAEMSCLLAQLFAQDTTQEPECGETMLVELDSHGFQRLLHDTPLEAPSIADLLHGSKPAMDAIGEPVTTRGYRLIPQPLRPRPTIQCNLDRVDQALTMVATAATTLIVPCADTLVYARAGDQTSELELFAEGLVGDASVLVVTARGGLASMYGLVNLVREALRHFTNVREILLGVTDPRGPMRRGRELHELLEEAIPEGIAQLHTLEIVTLQGLDLDDYHHGVLAFPGQSLRPLRSFVHRARELPLVVPSLKPDLVAHPYYERIDPLLDFFANVEA